MGMRYSARPNLSVPTPPPPSTRGKAGRNHLNEEINTPFLPTGIGERFSQTTSNLGHAELRVNSPINKNAELTRGASGGPLVNSVL
jgi:hypothetical protein